MRRRTAFVVAVALALAAGLVAAPRRYVVEGVSMGPGLLPGDVVASGWLPDRDRWRRPRRFDRWIVTLPDGSTGLKRVAGLPEETVSLVAGDLAIDGERVLKSPRLLAETGSVAGPFAAAHDGGRSWSRPATTVLDDDAFADDVSRLLLPVRDAGFAAEVAVPPAALDAGPVRLRAEAGPLVVHWRLRSAGRFAIVAGRLDGQAVAAAWPLPAHASHRDAGRGCLPPGAPERWSVARPWPEDDGDDERGPAMLVGVLTDGRGVRIERVSTWRDVLHRPPADGTTVWRLGPDELLVLGDFPAGSRDSRHFGPLPSSALRHRVGPTPWQAGEMAGDCSAP